MIIIEWYNIVAIVVSIILFIWGYKHKDDRGLFGGIEQIYAIIIAIFFYALWGGIFWW